MKGFVSSLLLFAAFASVASAQSICDTVYVWNFLDEHGKQTNDTKKITTHFESSLTQYSECYVVDRREFSLLYEQNRNEQEVLTLSDVEQYRVQLKTTKAKIVVFGRIAFDDISDVYILTVKFQDIETSRLLRSSPLNIERATMRDVPKLQASIDKFMCSLIKGRECTSTAPLEKDKIKEAEPPAAAQINWEGMVGRLAWVSVASDGSVWGVNLAGEIYRWNGSGFNKTTEGRLMQISAGSAQNVWGVSTNNQVWKWNGSNDWTKMPGGLKQISVGADGTVWGVSSNDQIWAWNGSNWDRVSGGLMQISVGNSQHIWGVSSNNQIWRRSGGDWERIPGFLKNVSVGADGTVWGVNAQEEIFQWDGKAFVKTANGLLKQISVGNAQYVWGLNNKGQIYRKGK